MTRVLIVEDQALFADVIRLSLLDTMGMEVPPPCSSGAEAIAALMREEPDLVLLDIGLPDQSGLSVGREMIGLRPGTKVVAVTAMEDPRIAAQAMRSGFRGYLTKDVTVSTFVRCIRTVLDGQVVFPSRHIAAVMRRAPADDAVSLMVGQLTQREREVLGQLVEGRSGRQIATDLVVSPHTIRTHVQSILQKLQVHSRLEAAAFAVRHGIAMPPGSPAERRQFDVA